jgi:hypothetical protein
LFDKKTFEPQRAQRTQRKQRKAKKLATSTSSAQAPNFTEKHGKGSGHKERKEFEARSFATSTRLSTGSSKDDRLWMTCGGGLAQTKHTFVLRLLFYIESKVVVELFFECFLELSQNSFLDPTSIFKSLLCVLCVFAVE